ncbi:hypothetical protein K4K60_003304 [Colletotrichum sp. SAR11_57]|nr:hypothetical protein K4K60_003304 [Colletotrichum sp. SAR11_57]
MDTRHFAFEGFASSSDTEMKDNPADRSNMADPFLTTPSLNFIRVQQEQLRALFLEATKAAAASAATIQGYQNHQDFARHYSIELKLAVEQCGFIAEDHRGYKAELEDLKKKLVQVSKELNDTKRTQCVMKKDYEAMKSKQETSERENEALKRDMKELQQLFRVHVL